MRSRTLDIHYSPIEAMLILCIQDASHQRRLVPALVGLMSAFLLRRVDVSRIRHFATVSQ